jgi:subtilisin family serine protease
MKFKKAFTLFTLLIVLILMIGVFPASADSAVPAGATSQQTGASLPQNFSNGVNQTYIVLYKAESVSSDAASVIAKAGGTLVYSYSKIGVVIARSSNDSFRSNLLSDKRIEGAVATTNFATQLSDDLNATDGAESVLNTPVTDSSEPLFGLQWDMVQIHTPEAHAITGGSPSVIVGDLDTGLDFTHPDLAPNYDASRSIDCSSGAPQPLLPGNDQAGHGTHTAGTIAAAANSIGIVGVAPNVKIAGIKSSNDDGYFFPEMVVCAFVWAGDHGIDVTNNSYFADPWLFNCRNDHEQHAIWKAEQRAIRYAMSKGVTVVSSAGNENQDLTHPTIDEISPDYPPGSAVPREITNACVRIPAEIPGVITVSANGNLQQKSYYSDYGIGVIDVVAPGGDRLFQITSAAPNGRVLSTWPTYLPNPGALGVSDCSVSPCAPYRYLQGTSMAGPHVAGVAALLISANGNKMSPGAVAAKIGNTADPQACPENPFLGGTGFDATCQGGGGNNGFYGKGQVNAYNAVAP